MDNKPEVTPDELPKEKIVKKILASKRRYFFPERSFSVEAESIDEAIALVNNSNKEKDGDA